MKRRLYLWGLGLALAASVLSATPAAASVAGSVSAWGNNYDGQLGIGSSGNVSRTAMEVQGLSHVVAIAGGGEHSLALKSDGTVWAWGQNQWYGQLGNGGTANSSTPVLVQGLSNVVAISAGRSHSLALKSDGTVWAWGYNVNGELGIGSSESFTRTPAMVQGLTDVVAISARGRHSLALKSDGTVWAWGFGYYGQLGIGVVDSSRTPVKVFSIDNVVAIAAGADHSLALKSDGTVWAWGRNAFGQVGNGRDWSDTYTPTKVVGLTEVVAIAGGGFHGLALKSDGTVWTWGMNREGQLGDGSAIDGSLRKSHTPGQALIADVVAIAGGSGHSLALMPDGTVRAWGQNYYGELGNGGSANSSTPTAVPGLGSVAAIAGGLSHSLAILSPGDTEPPVITLSADSLLLPADATGFAKYDPAVTAVDEVDPSPLLSWSPSGLLPVGVHTVVFTATDGSGNTATASQLVVVYDPDGGFVTGAGWIDSPAGAYVADPSLGGKAIFGFVSKYVKGATAPSGQTNFRFQTGDLVFQSTSYEWLVAAQNGSYAQFKGIGTINGSGSYKFMLRAGDGPPDTLRIRIWEEVGALESTIYDNGLDQAIGAGSIVVQKS